MNGGMRLILAASQTATISMACAAQPSSYEAEQVPSLPSKTRIPVPIDIKSWPVWIKRTYPTAAARARRGGPLGLCVELQGRASCRAPNSRWCGVSGDDRVPPRQACARQRWPSDNRCICKHDHIFKGLCSAARL